MDDFLIGSKQKCELITLDEGELAFLSLEQVAMYE